jgi:diguanylate cyclase (GGDEF)-like protein
LEEKGKELFSKYKIFKIPVGVIMFDIDNFKKINDTYGHDTGDKVLKTLAQTVKKIIRKNDYFIRYGGEEFLLILPYSEPKSTKKVAEKIRKEIEKLSLSIDNRKLKFTVSMGISKLKPEDKTIMDAIKRADERLYRAKNRGKNRIET